MKVDEKTKILNDVFGYKTFRPGQEKIIDCILDYSNQGVLVVMPTGGGKSLLYQIPALVCKKLTVVVSPLISLMKDQVDTLESLGVEAQLYNSSLTKKQKQGVINSLQMGIVDILYVAPERFDDNDFVELLIDCGVEIFAVDEAHCVSQWGPDFRPSYSRLGSVIDRIGPKQVIALTATATPRVQDDICEKINMKSAKRFIQGFYRDNLIIKIDSNCTGNDKITSVIRKVQHYYHKKNIETGVVYSSTKKNAEVICGRLQTAGVPATFYHAGLKDSERKNIQEQWSKNGGIIVATCAFGMGIDKSDVRFVIHSSMPGNLEAWYQEIGRAGRDGLPAVCQMYCGGDDIYLQNFFIDMTNPESSRIRNFWYWLNDYAMQENTFNNKAILRMTQNEMSEISETPSNIISACISALRKSGIVKTVGRGVYEVEVFEDSDNAPIDYASFDKKRQEKIDRLMEMVSFVRNNNDCRFKNIIRYFGENMNKPCGKCDWCQRKDGRM